MLKELKKCQIGLGYTTCRPKGIYRGEKCMSNQSIDFKTVFIYLFKYILFYTVQTPATPYHNTVSSQPLYDTSTASNHESSRFALFVWIMVNRHSRCTNRPWQRKLNVQTARHLWRVSMKTEIIITLFSWLIVSKSMKCQVNVSWTVSNLLHLPTG